MRLLPTRRPEEEPVTHETVHAERLAIARRVQSESDGAVTAARRLVARARAYTEGVHWEHFDRIEWLVDHLSSHVRVLGDPFAADWSHARARVEAVHRELLRETAALRDDLARATTAPPRHTT